MLSSIALSSTRSSSQFTRPFHRASLTRHCRWGLLAAFCSFATAGTPLRAHAEQAQLQPQSEQQKQERPKYGYWSDGEPRFFISQKSELGIPYTKPYFSAGYGIPHWIWTGVDVNAILTPDCFQAYGGVRLSAPVIDFAFGIRDTWSFSKRFLEPAQSFTHAMVTDVPGELARYWAWEAEAVGTIPLPYSALVADFIAIRTLDVPKGKYVYDESYRAVVAKPLFFTLRLAAVARFLREDSFKVGVITEYVFNAGRDEMVVRAGPAASLTLTDHLEVNAVLSLKVAGPDHLGIALGAYGVAGVRWRWATGEKRPMLPWKEDLIPLPF